MNIDYWNFYQKCTPMILRDHRKRKAISVPDRVIQSQLARPTCLPEFNLDVKCESQRVLICAICIILAWLTSVQNLGLWIYARIQATQVGQAKPAARKAHWGVPSWERMLDQSTFGKRPGSHSQHRHRCHSRSSMFKPAGVAQQK